MSVHTQPLALSLSKPVLSDAAGGVEGGGLQHSNPGFDRLSPSGSVE